MSPGQAEVEAQRDKLKAYNPPKAGENPATYDARIQDMLTKQGNQIQDSLKAPLDQGVKDRAKVSLQETLNTLPTDKALDATQFEEARKNGSIKQYTSANIPTNSADIQAFLRDNPSSVISLDGKQYKLRNGGAVTTSYSTLGYPRHTEQAVITDENGNTHYVIGGKIVDKPLKDVSGKYWSMPWE
jgi:hypothetical protein